MSLYDLDVEKDAKGFRREAGDYVSVGVSMFKRIASISWKRSFNCMMGFA